MFEDLTDEELTRKILKNKKSEPDPHLNALFWRYFDKFEKNIRAVLRSHGIAYNDDETFYNYVFDGVYEKLFSHRNFKKIASKYDPDRSTSFRHWFLGKIKRHRIRDWLRSRSPERNRTNRTHLIMKYPTHSFLEHIHRPSDQKSAATSHQKKAPEDSRDHLLNESLQRLSTLDRIIIKLLYYGISPISKDEFDYLTENTGKDRKQVLEVLAEYENNFKQQYEKDLNQAFELNALLGTKYFLLSQNEKRMYKKTEEIENLMGTDISRQELAKKSENETILTLSEAIAGKQQALSEGALTSIEYKRQVAVLELMILAVRRRRLKKKIHRINEQLEHLFKPINQAVREVVEMDSKSFSYRKMAALNKIKNDCKRRNRGSNTP